LRRRKNSVGGPPRGIAVFATFTEKEVETGQIFTGPPYAPCWSVPAEKRIVYILRSAADPSHHYVGLTSDLAARLAGHNADDGGHTRRHRPWSMLVSIEFPAEPSARRFEAYLKTGSGRAFAMRHFGDVQLAANESIPGT
jgi:putative endonuclease